MFQLPPALVGAYVNSRRQDLASLHDALRNKDLAEFHRVGHQMAGMAINYGFPELESLGLKMENLTPTDLECEGSKLVSELADWLNGQIG